MYIGNLNTFFKTCCFEYKLKLKKALESQRHPSPPTCRGRGAGGEGAKAGASIKLICFLSEITIHITIPNAMRHASARQG